MAVPASARKGRHDRVTRIAPLVSADAAGAVAAAATAHTAAGGHALRAGRRGQVAPGRHGHLMLQQRKHRSVRNTPTRLRCRPAIVCFCCGTRSWQPSQMQPY